MTIHATITGRLGADPELRSTASGTPMLRLRLASSHGWGDRETTTWVGCTMFGRRAESVARLLSKGSYVTVRGAVYETEGQDGRRYLNCDVDDIDLPPKSVNAGAAPAREQERPAAYGSQPTGSDDDIPF